MNPSRDDRGQASEASDVVVRRMAADEVVRACADRVRRLESEMRELRSLLESMGTKSTTVRAQRD
jgi:hypothetical protein